MHTWEDVQEMLDFIEKQDNPEEAAEYLNAIQREKFLRENNLFEDDGEV